MSKAQVLIIADSISPDGKRITTFQNRYWRPLHPELMTHRVFSRNAGSSRARPSVTIIEQVAENPWMPIHWGKNQPGMQANNEQDELVYIPVVLRKAWNDFAGDDWNDGLRAVPPQKAWHFTAHLNALMAQSFNEAEYHKQIVNRLLEPFTYIDVVLTATNFANWFALRDHPDAQPEIQELARLMRDALDASTPKVLMPGEWHLPYITDEDWKAAERYCQIGRITRDMPSYMEKLGVVRKISVARCARVSYKAFDGTVSPIEKDLRLFNQLLVSQPLHASPAEHQATPDAQYNNMGGGLEQWMNPELHGNFDGWIQFRKTLPNEFVAG